VRSASRSGDGAFISVRPENVRLSRSGASGDSATSGRVESVTFVGEMTECEVTIGERRIRSRMLSPGDFAAGDVMPVEMRQESVAPV
jgi:ABC-type Fe3+/spermidine/putrescine transport system ATPase subunit